MKKIVFLLFIIAGLVFVVTQKQFFSDTPSYDKISNLDIKTVQQISIYSLDRKPIQFIKKNNIWHIIIEQNEIPTNPSKMNALLSLPNAASLRSFSVSSDQLKQYKLLKPRLTVKYDDFAIAFGGNEPLQRRRYILVNRKIHLIGSLYYHFLLQSINVYTQKDEN